MKLIEIKNSLAKLYYEPMDFPIVLSDFLTIDDGNQKIIAQVVSIETTSSDTTNCAILKFSIDLNADNTFCTYSGYVPSLDALVSKTKANIIEAIFSDQTSGVKLGKLTSSAKVSINLKGSIMEKFLYIQSDRADETEEILSKILTFNSSKVLKTLYIDFEGMNDFKYGKVVKFGHNFKLPIVPDILNHIYEKDLTGLTIEQKAIVRDIILEIQEYITTLDTGFIPFDALLDVVNDIYQTDKSTGIILFRNKLLKYKQSGIFASKEDEILSLAESIANNTLTSLDLSNIEPNWQKTAFEFVIEFLETECSVIFNVKDESVSQEVLNMLYKAKQIKPIVASRYDSTHVTQLKSFAKNMIMFKPQTQQKAFASYNSFLNKMAQHEFVISGEATHYTPLIIKEIPQVILQIEPLKQSLFAKALYTPTIEEKDDNSTTQEKVIENKNIEEITVQAQEEMPEDVLSIEDLEELDAMENFSDFDENVLLAENENINDTEIVVEDTLEQEIAKDVDKMFYAEAAIQENQLPTKEDPVNIEQETMQDLDYSDMFTEAELDMIGNIDDELPGLFEDEVNNSDNAPDESLENETNDVANDIINIEEEQESSIVPMASPIFETEEQEPSVPIYKTEIEEKIENSKALSIEEGSIVYHEKYGRGVVEQLINYGSKAFCSILFDNIGRRLLDPNLADLKQM